VLYVIIFAVLAVVVVAAGASAMSRQRQRFRDAGIADDAPQEEEEDM
jgi:hypothetical protein